MHRPAPLAALLLLLAACGREPVPAAPPAATAAAPAPTTTVAWQAIEGVPALPTAEERFRRLTPIGGSGTAPWSVATGAQNAAAALGTAPGPEGAALAWDVTWTGVQKLEYGELVCDLPLTAEAAAIAWSQFQQPGTPRPALRVRLVDGSGECHQYTATTRPPAAATGWFPVLVELGHPDGVWGGDGNRKLDPPVRLHSLLADRPGAGFTGRAELRLAGIAVLTKRPPVAEAALALAVADPPAGHLYQAGASGALRARLPQGRLAWTITGLAGDRLGGGSASAPEAVIPLPLTRPGWYDCTVEAIDGAARSVRSYRWAVLPAGPAPRNARLGVCTHFVRTDLWPAAALPLVPRLGLGAIRDELPWSLTERTVGTLDIPKGPAWFLPEARALGLETLLILCYGNRAHGGSWPVTPEARAAFAAWAGRFAAAVPQAAAFEVWNEWTVGTGVPADKRTPGANTPAAYTELLRATAAAVRAARPDATLVGIGGEHPRWQHEAWTGMLAAGAGPLADVASFHPYRWQADAESTGLAEEVEEAAAAVKAAGGSGRLWITEIGWTSTPAGPDGSDVRSHGRHLVRALALLASVPAVERTFIYDLMDDGRDPLEKEHHFGLLHHRSLGLMPKPAAVAVAAFSRLTAGAACLGRARRGEAWLVRFRLADGDDLVMAWTAGPALPLAGLLTGAVAASWDAGGAALAQPPAAIGDWPVYLRGRGLAPAP